MQILVASLFNKNLEAMGDSALKDYFLAQCDRSKSATPGDIERVKDEIRKVKLVNVTVSKPSRRKRIDEQ